MRIEEENLLEDVKKCLTDPIYNITQNFSLQKSKEYYNKWAKQWEMGDYNLNLANKVEELQFPFTNLDELAVKSIEAQNVYTNLKKEDYIKWCSWCVYWKKVVVRWNRLKTFEEWLHDGLEDALKSFYEEPEWGVRKMLIEKLGEWYYGNTEIHLFAAEKIDEDVLLRLWQHEEPRSVEDRDIEEDILSARQALLDMEECNTKKDVEVLTLKM